MNELERLVWATVFANSYSEESEFIRKHGHRRTKDISGFSCGEIADSAVDKLRESFVCDDAEYLYPVKEKWS